MLPLSLLAACCRFSLQKVAERWNRLFPKAKMNEAEQPERINAWLAQDGKIANMSAIKAPVTAASDYAAFAGRFLAPA